MEKDHFMHALDFQTSPSSSILHEAVRWTRHTELRWSKRTHFERKLAVLFSNIRFRTSESWQSSSFSVIPTKCTMKLLCRCHRYIKKKTLTNARICQNYSDSKSDYTADSLKYELCSSKERQCYSEVGYFPPITQIVATN